MAGFQKAKKEKIFLKVLLAGASGSGKSFSALRLATGIVNKTGGRIAAIDTEAGRIRYYANEFDFDDLQLENGPCEIKCTTKCTVQPNWRSL